MTVTMVNVKKPVKRSDSSALKHVPLRPCVSMPRNVGKYAKNKWAILAKVERGYCTGFPALACPDTPGLVLPSTNSSAIGFSPALRPDASVRHQHPENRYNFRVGRCLISILIIFLPGKILLRHIWLPTLHVGRWPVSLTNAVVSRWRR